MHIYLPIAEMSVNLILVVGIGGFIGLLSGLFGVGGGFLLTPLLMLIGIPPAIAVASGANEIVAAAASGAAAHYRMGHVDFKMGAVLIVAGLVGSTFGVHIVKWLRHWGNFDLVFGLSYVIMLGSIGGLMFIESLRSLRRFPDESALQKHTGLGTPPTQGILQKLPFQVEFRSMGVKTSLLLPVGVGILVGFMTSLMGVGGGFIMMPIMIYVMGMPTVMAVGTSLLQITFTSANVTVLSAVVNHTVDAVLAATLFIGSVIGAQVGARMSSNLSGEQIKIWFAGIVLVVAGFMAYELVATPHNMIDFIR